MYTRISREESHCSRTDRKLGDDACARLERLLRGALPEVVQQGHSDLHLLENVHARAS